MKFILSAMVVIGIAVFFIFSGLTSTLQENLNLLIFKESPFETPKEHTTTERPTMKTPMNFHGPTGAPYIIGPKSNPPNY